MAWAPVVVPAAVPLAAAPAAAVGMPREFVKQAIQQLQAEQRAQAARRTARWRRGSAMAIAVAVFLLRPVLGFPRQRVYFYVSDEVKQAPIF
jgi:hypothetical protein